MENHKDLRTTWKKALISFFSPIFWILIFRWILFEPYLIPSGSMLQTLQINDHILASKFTYGLRIPFTKQWLWRWSEPQRGDIVVFRYPVDTNTFYVKRVIGLPGETIRIEGKKIFINDKELQYKELSENNFLEENWDIQFDSIGLRQDKTYVVSDKSYFVLGDNRDSSLDSRYWGMLPEELLVGRVDFIWLACRKMLEAYPFLCDFNEIDWNRIGFLK